MTTADGSPVLAYYVSTHSPGNPLSVQEVLVGN